MDHAIKSGPRVEKIETTGFSGLGDPLESSMRGLPFGQPLPVQLQRQLISSSWRKTITLYVSLDSIPGKTRLSKTSLWSRMTKRRTKFQTNLVTDLWPEVGAELWPSFEVSGLAGWEGFLGWAESAQL